MSLIRIEHHPSRGQLRLFGLLWLVFFGILGLVTSWKTDARTAAAVLWTVALVVPVIGWTVPALMRVVYLGMAYLAWPIGFVVSHVILAATFYLMLTPIGLVMRLCGYDPLKRKFEPEAETYWSPRETVEDTSRYFRQF